MRWTRIFDSNLQRTEATDQSLYTCSWASKVELGRFYQLAAKKRHKESKTTIRPLGVQIKRFCFR
jgi:hypothetical protein